MGCFYWFPVWLRLLKLFVVALMVVVAALWVAIVELRLVCYCLDLVLLWMFA